MIDRHHAPRPVLRPGGKWHAIRVVPGAQLHQQPQRMAVQQDAAAFHETGAIEFPVIFQMENVGRVDLGIGLVDQADLADSLAGPEIFGAEAFAHLLGIGVAVFRDDDARHAPFGLMIHETFQRPRQQIVAVTRCNNNGDVAVWRVRLGHGTAQ